MKRKKYAIIGLSGRSAAFTKKIIGEYKVTSEIVALLDSNYKRMEEFNRENDSDYPCYGIKDFDKMVDETKPDAVIISTTDATHHTYIIAALARDITVITEKPMTIDEEKVKMILAARYQSKADIIVTHNYRYQPVHTQIKELLMEGYIGKPLQVDFNYYLDTLHGASYFKRWNRYKKESGSLLVTKACHHFDLINWYLAQNPVEVFAYGALNYYGPEGAYNPEKIDGRRCSSCKTKCMYFKRHASTEDASSNERLINFNNPGKNELFGSVDGSYSDRCIFDSDIDTWDTFSLVVKYAGGAMMNYSLNASMPYEGYRLMINGTEGRIETETFHPDPGRLPFPKPAPQNIRYIPLFGGMQTINVLTGEGGHGGADPLLAKDIFEKPDTEDKTMRFADHNDGAMAVLVGIAARKSLQTGSPVKIADLLA